MMMKITNRFIVLLGFLSLATFCFTPLLCKAQTNRFVTIALPAESIDFSDLDIRDELNRPVKNSDASRSFDALVQYHLHKTLLDNLTPNNQFVRNILSLNYDVISGWIRREFEDSHTVITSLLPNSKKWFLFFLFTRFNHTTHTPSAFRVQAVNNVFFYLISSLLSSTQILR